jgi:TetR/AcrR family tetracycline transcriptional repressor
VIAGRARLDRDQVVRAAIELLDEVGLEALSLRRLASKLGVQAPTLYWHIDSKEALLRLMSEAIAADHPPRPPRPGETWDQWLADRARQLRRTLNAHRDGAMLDASARPAAWPVVEMQLGVLVAAGLTPGDALRAFIAISRYVSGFTLEEQAHRVRSEHKPTPGPAEWAAARAELEPYPLLQAALHAVGDPQGEHAFESGLRFVIDGIRANLDHTDTTVSRRARVPRRQPR